MKYYVVADIHGFFKEFKVALEEKGFFEDKGPHQLIVCGDLFDRGNEAQELQNFILELLKKKEVILIKGNHEDLFLNLIDDADYWMTSGIIRTHHWSNGTVGTALQLTRMDLNDALDHPNEFKAKAKSTPFYQTIIPAMRNYFETKNYIFVHGWIPCKASGRGVQKYDTFYFVDNWREQGEEEWYNARWFNGMAAAYNGIYEENKTIVCGHWHCSYGHAILENKGNEFGEDADFSPYYSKGIIAIDACTSYSKKVNCIVIEDEEIKK